MRAKKWVNYHVATAEIKRLLNLKDLARNHGMFGIYDFMDEKRKIYELKTTADLNYYYKMRNNPFPYISNYQQANIDRLDFVLLVHFEEKTGKILKSCIVNAKSMKLIKDFQP